MSININYPYITDYIRQNICPRVGILAEMEQYAKLNNVPISQPEAIRFIEVMCRIIRPERILEIGTAIGYSSIAMAKAAGGVQIVTVEKSEEMFKIAKANIAAENLEGRINVIYSDALDVLKNLDSKFDMIFMDAAKGQYMQFLPDVIRLLKSGGVLISDNVLYQGMVATDDLFVKRKCTIIKNLREYITEISQSPLLDTSILPLGDGVAISYKLESDLE